jgi:hypothetical protein
MQTVSKRSIHKVFSPEKPAQSAASRHSGAGAANVVIFAIVFGAYALLVAQMATLDFDTAFLAAYCTILTIFVGRAFLFVLHPDYRD